MILANNFSLGTGAISANGSAGVNSSGYGGASGGGAGGSILLNSAISFAINSSTTATGGTGGVKEVIKAEVGVVVV